MPDLPSRAVARAALPIREPVAYGQSCLVLGGAQLGGTYGIANTSGMPDDGTTVAMLDLAARAGVTHVDTARAYGDSERRIGDALAALATSPLRLVTKIAPLHPTERTDPEAGAVAVREHVTASRAALRVAAPITVLYHRAPDARATWPALRAVRDAAGGIDRIGVSVQSPTELLDVLGLPDLGYVQLPCNVLDGRWRTPRVADALAGAPDLVVTVRSVYLQGLLAAGRSVSWPYVSDPDRDALVATLDRIAADLGRLGRVDLCVAYVLGLPGVTSVVIGADRPEQLRANVDLARRRPLGPDERAAVDRALPSVPANLLDPATWGQA
jgi:aryl-alcohol dehydrogenase-like predicted oxidoreductase